MTARRAGRIALISFAMRASSTAAARKTRALRLTSPARVSYRPGTSAGGGSAHGDSQHRRPRRGTDGARHRPGGRTGGLRDVHGQGDAGPSRCAARPGREAAPEGRREGQAHRGRSRRIARSPPLDHPPPRPGRRRPGDRVDRRGAAREARALLAARRRREGRRHLRDQHVDPDGGRARRRDAPAGALRRDCTSSTPCTP